ncbi:MAG: hypothetical protein F6K18_32240 [Okeania sp. SIO2C2]|uniref:hypothetical protein n=1 Tax=Okeania sp. SIO2C2 TaxID=2607787 RepID=UPI0013BA7869|nr:hypothetical protein [Okeania sp. SIO2C2]NEP91107.1 hypothetical protein [Okeania sp. SIO2C2]
MNEDTLVVFVKAFEERYDKIQDGVASANVQVATLTAQAKTIGYLDLTGGKISKELDTLGKTVRQFSNEIDAINQALDEMIGDSGISLNKSNFNQVNVLNEKANGINQVIKQINEKLTKVKAYLIENNVIAALTNFIGEIQQFLSKASIRTIKVAMKALNELEDRFPVLEEKVRNVLRGLTKRFLPKDDNADGK